MTQRKTISQNSSNSTGARPTRQPKPSRIQDSQKAQLERFREAAREHECELDEAAFDEALRKVFPPKTGAG
jgi:hypothetical protein